MKKLIVLLTGCLLTVNLALAGQPTEADQKWLAAVEKKVTAGETEVSTPSDERVELAKDWAASNGFTVKVTRATRSYHLEFSKHLAQK